MLFYFKNSKKEKSKNLINTKINNSEEILYELTLPKHTAYRLEKRLNGIVAIVKGFKSDILYFTDKNPSKVANKIKRLCGNIRYTCAAVPMQKGVN